MKRIGYWRQTEKDFIGNLPWPKEGRLPMETKKLLTEYLMKGKQHSVWKGYSRCRICGKMNGTACLTDGEFIYPDGYAHYILEHNIEPDLDLLAKVLTTT